MKPKTYRYKGESKTLGEWAKHLGIPYNNLFMRLKQGWDFARAVEEPIRPRGAPERRVGAAIVVQESSRLTLLIEVEIP